MNDLFIQTTIADLVVVYDRGRGRNLEIISGIILYTQVDQQDELAVGYMQLKGIARGLSMAR